MKALRNIDMRKINITRSGRLQLGRHFGIHILLPPLIFAAYIGDYLSMFAISWMSALLHESAHILALRRLKIPVSGIMLQPFGACAEISTPVIKSPCHEIIMALAGPLCNLILCVIFGALLQYCPSELLQYAITANLAMFCLNLLPCLPLDGGRILRALLTLSSDALTALQVSIRISRIISAGILGAAIYLLLTSRFNFSLILIGSFLLGNLCFEQKNISLQTLREILYYKEKPDREQLNNTCVLTAYADLPARKLLRRLSYHKYHIVHVIDRNRRVINTLTEGQILNALLNESIRITLGEIK